jgi:GDPmannose 4,6-dehydratase
VRAFVTGIGGQDGSYLAERLLADGVEVHALTHPADDLAHCPDAVVLHRGDVTQTADTRRLLVDLAPDEVYNLAALSSVAQSWERPEETARVNGTAAVALLAAALDVQLQRRRPVRFVQASSAEIFGLPDRSPQDERTPVRPVNPYGEAKALAHRALGEHREGGLHAVSAILYNHESPRRPERFVSRKITATVAAIARGEAETLSLGNVEARRDWGWAPDYVEAMVLAARAEEPDDYVVATGESHSVREFAMAAFAHAGIDDGAERLRVDASLTRPSDAAELTGDASRARARLGWKPTVSFAELVGRMVDADLGRGVSGG